MKRFRYTSVLIVALILALVGGDGWHASEAARIKDIASIEGVRDNQLIGYGLVVGDNLHAELHGH